MNFNEFKVPQQLIDFVLVTLFSLIIGLSQRRLHPKEEGYKIFGTDRTFTFIGILGYILFILQSQTMILFIGGGFVLTILFGMYYFHKLHVIGKYGITTIIIALITYCIAPIVITQPKWLVILIIVTVLIFTELKESFLQISRKFDKDEFITLGKFLVILGVVLPIIPDEPIVSFLSITPYKIWLAVVVISSISYLSYLLKKFVFINSGVVLSGILGGLYSSTATTIILSRKSKGATSYFNQYVAAIIFATTMKYIRVLIIMVIFNIELAKLIYPIFLIMTLISAIIGFYFLMFKKDNYVVPDAATHDKNPLEFKVALLFTTLFVFFSVVTYYAIYYFGNQGLNILSIVVGVTDIDPFLINIFQGKYNVELTILGVAALNAIISNNVVKALYCVFLSHKKIHKSLIISFSILVLINVILEFIFL